MHDASHSGTSPGRGPQTGRVRWTRKLTGSGTPGPVVSADGEILVATNEGVFTRWTPVPARMSGLRLRQPRWHRPLGEPRRAPQRRHRLASTRRVADRSVRGGRRCGGCRCTATRRLRPSTPTGLSWAIPLAGSMRFGSPPWPAQHQLVARGGQRFVRVSRSGPWCHLSTVTNGVVALTADGQLRWRHALPAPVEVSPAVTSDGGVVVGAGGTREYGLDAAGRVRWEHDRRAETYSSPIVTSDDSPPSATMPAS